MDWFNSIALWVGYLTMVLYALLGGALITVSTLYLAINTIYRRGNHSKAFIQYMMARRK